MVLRRLFRRPPRLGLASVVVAKGGCGGATLDGSGEVVGLSLERGTYFALNDVASHIWRLLGEPRAVAELCDLIEPEYDVDRARLEAEVLRFVASLVEHDMATVSDAQARPPGRAAGR